MKVLHKWLFIIGIIFITIGIYLQIQQSQVEKTLPYFDTLALEGSKSPYVC